MKKTHLLISILADTDVFLSGGKEKKTLNIVKWLSRSDLSLMTKQKRTVADFQIFADKIRSVDKVRLIC